MKDSKNLVIGLLCAVLCVMAVGYAAFSTNLEIGTTVKIDSSWDVAITSVGCTTSAVTGGVGGQSAQLEGALTATTANFKMSLVQPGDSATCNITVTNAGNINAKLTGITVTESGNGPITFTVTPTQDTLAGRNTLSANNGYETIQVTGVYNNVGGQGSALGETKTVGVALTYTQVQ